MPLALCLSRSLARSLSASLGRSLSVSLAHSLSLLSLSLSLPVALSLSRAPSLSRALSLSLALSPFLSRAVSLPLPRCLPPAALFRSLALSNVVAICTKCSARGRSARSSSQIPLAGLYWPPPVEALKNRICGDDGLYNHTDAGVQPGPMMAPTLLCL